MYIVFGLFLLAVLIAGLLHRRHEKKRWIAVERYDEEGRWLDKRAGERGTYGSLDEEMEQERRYVARQGRINELAALLRNFAFEHIPDFHTRSDDAIKSYNAAARARAQEILDAAARLPAQALPAFQSAELTEPAQKELHKSVLRYVYQEYPTLLDLDIDTLRAFDAFVTAKLTEALSA